MEVIMSAFEEQRRVSLGGGRQVVLSRKTVDYDDFSKLEVLGENDVLLEHGGGRMNRIILQASDALLEGTRFLFAQTINDRDDNDMLRPVSSRIHAVDMTVLRIEEDVIKDAIGPDEECLGLDVDPAGRYVLLPYVGEDPDCPGLRIYDDKEKALREINTDELVDYIMQNVRWKDSDTVIEFFNPYSEGTVTASIDRDAGRVVLQERTA
jgi:hypothetical protein